MSFDDSSIIELNVGGVYYTTSYKTLNAEPNSLFVSLLDPNHLVKDAQNKIFIDRDGLLFKYLLEYLRNKTLVLPENFLEKSRLKQEAEYFKLNNMVKMFECMDMSSLSLTNISDRSSVSLNSTVPSLIGRKKISNGCIIVGYRGTFANGRDGLADVKFRKISRILVCGRVLLCREVFGDALNESRDPDHGVSDRYTSRFFLKHTFLEQAFDTLIESNFQLVCAAATGTNSSSDKDMHNKVSIDSEENKWLHYNEFVFVRNT